MSANLRHGAQTQLQHFYHNAVVQGKTIYGEKWQHMHQRIEAVCGFCQESLYFTEGEFAQLVAHLEQISMPNILTADKDFRTFWDGWNLWGGLLHSPQARISRQAFSELQKLFCACVPAYNKRVMEERKHSSWWVRLCARVRGVDTLLSLPDGFTGKR